MPRADRAAAALLNELDITVPPIPVEDVARHIGAEVVEEDFADDEDISGLAIRDGERRIIGVNKQHAPARKRFTIAHEIGHLLLHTGRPVIMDRTFVSYRDRVSGLATDTDEMQANAFAAELLMPRAMVLDEVRRLTYESGRSDADLTKALAKRFKVSEDAMRYRLTNLGVIRP